MKQLLIPIVVGVLAGLGGGSGYAYMRASAKFVADSAQLAERAKHAPGDSTADAHAAADRAENSAADTAGLTADSAANMSSSAVHDSSADVTLTPADSIRALEAARAELRKARGTHTATDARTATKPATASAGDHSTQRNAASTSVETPGTLKAATAGKGDARPGGHDAAASPTGAATGAANSAANPPATATSAAALVKSARDAALNTPIPELRLAKIFSAMPAKDAAKVLDQMPDLEIRNLLALMSDRQAAAILTALPAARAAAIAKMGGKAATTP